MKHIEHILTFSVKIKTLSDARCPCGTRAGGVAVSFEKDAVFASPIYEVILNELPHLIS